MIYNLFPNFHVRHKGVSFYGPRMSDETADTDLITGLFSSTLSPWSWPGWFFFVKEKKLMKGFNLMPHSYIQK